MFREVQAAAPDFGLELISLEVLEPSPDFEAAFKEAISNQAGALLVLRDPLTIKHQQRIVDLAMDHRLPAM